MRQQADWHASVRGRARARGARPPASRPRWMAVLAALVGVHALVFWRWYQSRFPIAAADSTILEVRLVDEPTPPPRVSTSQPTRPTHIAAAMLPALPLSPPPVAAPESFAPPQPQLFERDGSVRLAPEARFISPHDTGIARGRELLARGHNLIHCRRSKFDDSPTPAEMASAVAQGAHMAHLVMGNPVDPLNDVGQQQQEEGAGEYAANKREIEERACDD